MKLNLKHLLKDVKTYPNWSSKSCYNIELRENENDLKVFYRINKNPFSKIIERDFPLVIDCTPRFCWALGFLKGEGANSKENSNYRRFTLTNTDPHLLNIVLDELDKSKILTRNKLPDKSFQILHSNLDKNKTINYWSKKLNLSKSKFKFINTDRINKRDASKKGVCHIYISDVLLRRVIDVINDKIMTNY